MTAAESFNGSSGSSPPDLNSDIFGPDAPDPLARALRRAKASAGALAQVLVDCAAAGEDPMACPAARSVMASTAESLAWLAELRAAEIFRNDRDDDSEMAK
jgi:hypothetical protein